MSRYAEEREERKERLEEERRYYATEEAREKERKDNAALDYLNQWGSLPESDEDLEENRPPKDYHKKQNSLEAWLSYLCYIQNVRAYGGDDNAYDELRDFDLLHCDDDREGIVNGW